jgi:predicted AAA+ superfamily ATPase
MLLRFLKNQILAALSATAAHKVICLFGARQIGKTTLMREIFDELPGRKEFFNGDFDNDRALFVPTREALQRIAANLEMRKLAF